MQNKNQPPQMERKLSSNQEQSILQNQEPPNSNRNLGQRKVNVKKIGNYLIFMDKQIGKGAFSKVYKAETPNMKGVMLACKEIPNATLYNILGDKGQEALQKEASISIMLKHPNIVRLYEVMKTENNNYLFFEYCDGGDLRGFLSEQPNKRLNELQAQRFIRQLGDALKVLYQHNIIHRDLKPQNILLSEKSVNANIKLADFGLARRYQTQDDLFETTCGTPIYMAPEIQRGEQYTEKADLWSVGIILFEMIAGFPPFFGQSKAELRRNIERGVYKLPSDVQVSKACLNLLIGLLQSEVSKRISWQDFFEHVFVKYDSTIYAVLLEGLAKDEQEQIKSEQDNQIKVQQQQKTDQKANNRYQEKVSQEEEQFAQLKQQQPPQLKQSPQLQKKGQDKQTSEKKQLLNQGSDLKIQNQNSDSVTQEDLEEAIDEIATSFDILFHRIQQARNLINFEIKQKFSLQTYQYDKELKFVIYRLSQEIRTALIIFSTQDFISAQKTDGLQHIFSRIQQLRQKYDQGNEEYSLRVFTNGPKEIRFTQFLIQKLSEKHGLKILSQIEKCFTYFLELTAYIQDIGYFIDQYCYNEISNDILLYALELIKQGACLESVYDYSEAKQKYLSAEFILQELERELYHSLKFSNEEPSSSEEQKTDQQIQKVNPPPQLRNAEKKIKSFTFNKQHMKIQFERNDEIAITEMLKHLEQRILSSDKNIILSES